ncbi:MAG: DUF6443 domain-containing protein [Bacteroidota bacterium]
MKSFLLLLALLPAGFGLHAQETQTYPAADIQSALGSGEVLTLSGSVAAGQTIQTVATGVLLSVATDLPPHHPFTYTLRLEVIPFTSTGQLDENRGGEVTLRVGKNATQVASDSLYDRQMLQLENAYGVQVRLLEGRYKDETDGSIEIDGSVPENVQLTLSFDQDAYLEIASAPFEVNGAYDDLHNEWVISWADVAHAIGYDVEWTWVDNYGQAYEVPGDADEILFDERDFQWNSTRIQTTQTSYPIPLIYSSGWLIYRVRAVGRYADHPDKLRYGKWSSDDEVKSTVNDWPHVYEVSSHENDKNWQYQASYAEDGKRKEVASYFDGTLRNRQTVTKINSDDNIIVGEVIYDAQGRPAIEILPVPTDGSRIGFHPNFTFNTSGSSYTYQDFDLDGQNILDVPNPGKAMASSTGAARYYALTNDLNVPFKERIPDSEGHPFSQIEYEPDNTGRIRRKGGVGVHHQLGSGQEMEYYYGTPEQKELNRLFGYSVGNKLRYKKNVVIDPNGQASISYIDPQGRTIATALAGVNPDHLDGLPDEDPLTESNLQHESITVDLLGKLSDDAVDTGFDNNIKGTSGETGPLPDQLVYNGTKVTPFDDELSFSYQLANDPSFRYGCDEPDSEKAYPLVYDFSIDVLDKNAASKLATPVSQQVDLSETDGTFELTAPLQAINMPRGSYRVSKRLAVHVPTMEQYADDYVERLQDPTDACYVAPETVSDLPALDLSGCFVTCEDCEAALITTYGDREGYATDQVAAYDFSELSYLTEEELSIEKARMKVAFENQWDALIVACRAPCADTNVTDGDDPVQDEVAVAVENSTMCAIAATALTNDMKPLGQYGNTTVNVYENQDPELPDTSENSDALNIFSMANELYSTRLNNGTEHHSWRNPYHPTLDERPAANATELYTKGHYYDEDGRVSYVPVKRTVTIEYDEEEEQEVEVITFDPPVFSTANPIPADRDRPDDEDYLVEPQHLSEASDFLSEGTWQDSWAHSLISYHPEYCYLVYANALCAVTARVGSGGPFMNSDGYDNYLQTTTTYEEAKANGLLDSEETLGELDPYFSTNIPGVQDARDIREDLMFEALTNNYNGSPHYLMKFTYATMACSSLGTCELAAVTSGAQILNAVEAFPDEAEKDQFWNTYKANYLAFKQVIQSLFANIYAKNNNCYNGCIGPDTPPTNLLTVISDYSSAIKNQVNGLINAGTQSICNDPLLDNYQNKAKRFKPSDNLYQSGDSNQDIYEDLSEYTNYEYYVSTGVCPLARDLEVFLAYHFDAYKGGNLTGTHTYGETYLSSRLFEDLGGTYPSEVTVEVEVAESGSDLTLQFLQNNEEVGDEPLTVTLPSGYAHSWSTYGAGWVITEVKNIYTSYENETFSYEVVARVQESEDSETFEEIILTGTTVARIAECSITETGGVGEYIPNGGGSDLASCSLESDFARSLTKLMYELERQGTINGSVLLNGLTVYANGFLPDFFETGSAVWFNENRSVYAIEVNGTRKMQMELEAPLDPAAIHAITGVNFSYAYNEAGEITHQNVRVTYQENLSLDAKVITGRIYESCTTSNDGDDCIGLDCDDDDDPILTVANPSNDVTLAARNSTGASCRLINFLCCGDINDLVGEEEVCDPTVAVDADLANTFGEELKTLLNGLITDGTITTENLGRTLSLENNAGYGAFLQNFFTYQSVDHAERFPDNDLLGIDFTNTKHVNFVLNSVFGPNNYSMRISFSDVFSFHFVFEAKYPNDGSRLPILPQTIENIALDPNRPDDDYRFLMTYVDQLGERETVPFTTLNARFHDRLIIKNNPELDPPQFGNYSYFLSRVHHRLSFRCDLMEKYKDTSLDTDPDLDPIDVIVCEEHRVEEIKFEGLCRQALNQSIQYIKDNNISTVNARTYRITESSAGLFAIFNNIFVDGFSLLPRASRMLEDVISLSAPSTNPEVNLEKEEFQLIVAGKSIVDDEEFRMDAVSSLAGYHFSRQSLTLNTRVKTEGNTVKSVSLTTYLEEDLNSIQEILNFYIVGVDTIGFEDVPGSNLNSAFNATNGRHITFKSNIVYRDWNNEIVTAKNVFSSMLYSSSSGAPLELNLTFCEVLDVELEETEDNYTELVCDNGEVDLKGKFSLHVKNLFNELIENNAFDDSNELKQMALTDYPEYSDFLKGFFTLNTAKFYRENPSRDIHNGAANYSDLDQVYMIWEKNAVSYVVHFMYADLFSFNIYLPIKSDFSSATRMSDVNLDDNDKFEFTFDDGQVLTSQYPLLCWAMNILGGWPGAQRSSLGIVYPYISTNISYGCDLGSKYSDVPVAGPPETFGNTNAYFLPEAFHSNEDLFELFIKEVLNAYFVNNAIELPLDDMESKDLDIVELYKQYAARYHPDFDFPAYNDKVTIRKFSYVPFLNPRGRVEFGGIRAVVTGEYRDLPVSLFGVDIIFEDDFNDVSEVLDVYLLRNTYLNTIYATIVYKNGDGEVVTARNVAISNEYRLDREPGQVFSPSSTELFSNLLSTSTQASARSEPVVLSSNSTKPLEVNSSAPTKLVENTVASANSVSETGTTRQSITNVLTTSGITGSIDIPDTPPTPCDSVRCVPEPLEPISCTEQYPEYIRLLDELGDVDTDLRLSEAAFCNNSLQYLMSDYAFYLETFNITSSFDLHYLSIQRFGATEFNYGYPGMSATYEEREPVIVSYYNHVNETEEADRLTWSAFATDYLDKPENQGICLPRPFTVDITDISIPLPDETTCEQFMTSVHTAYTRDNYESFLDLKREEFKKAYLSHAIDSAVEQLEMTYYDKEYQYTLYYYDQSGNLVQTVPPEGVDRLTESALNAGLNDQINQHRARDEIDEDPDLLPNHRLITEYRYNSLNQLVWQQTPDGGETRFAYDALGRIIASQNAKQLENNAFSYTSYDALGRITQAGEFLPDVAVTIEETTGKLVFAASGEEVPPYDEVPNPNADQPDQPATVRRHYPDNLATDRNEVTLTTYTEPVSFAADIFDTVAEGDDHAVNARNRVTVIYYYDQFTLGTTREEQYDHAIFYSYDIHGNVKELVQHDKALAVTDDPNSGMKKVQYEYDLISGNVNQVTYQKGAADQFMHRYTYDADNRITKVETSADGLLWEADASYAYFAHGPLARMELGAQKVQGTDYAYTLQGWLKGVNSENLQPAADMGGDGAIDSPTGRDAYGYSLSYFDRDYRAENATTAFVYSSDDRLQHDRDLYNGNIKQMITSWLGNNESVLPSQINHYDYDQLNRIKRMRGSQIDQGLLIPDGYQSTYTYDNNGNLQTLTRKAFDGDGVLRDMDNFTYQYELDAQGNKRSNRLRSVSDQASLDDHFDSDIDSGQPEDNYAYDAIGQLTKDEAEGITDIEWRVDGKVKEIRKNVDGEATTIRFTYDGLGNRTAKTVLPANKTTLYVRDAQGNTMAVYDKYEDTPIPGEEDPKNGVFLKEHHVYGSARLGLEEKEVQITEEAATDSLYTNAVGDKRYELSNHLGNVLSVVTDRKLITPDTETFLPDVVASNDYFPFGMLVPKPGESPSVTYLATMEDEHAVEERESFGVNYDRATRISAEVYNHTEEENANKSIRLSGERGETIGLAKLLEVREGDTIRLETYAKYLQPKPNTGPTGIVSGLATAFTIAFNISPTTLEGTANPTFDYFHDLFAAGPITTGDDRYDIPEAYLNYLFFDKSFTDNQFGFVQVTEDARVVSITGEHEKLELEVIAPADGYLYSYLSNESEQVTEVFFDDFRIDHIRANAFGPNLAYRYGFQGQERDDEIKGEGNSVNYKYRMHDPRVGRFFAVDPLEASYPWYSPYQFSGNRVIHKVELEGLEEADPKRGKNRNRSEGDESCGDVYHCGTYDDDGTVEFEEGWYSVSDYEKISNTNRVVQHFYSKSDGTTQEASIGAAGLSLLRSLPKAGAAAGSDGPLIVGDIFTVGIIIAALTPDVSTITYEPIVTDLTIDKPVEGSGDTELPVTVPINGNRRDNPNEHIVYEIWGYNPITLKNETLKYGISDAKYNTFNGSGSSRPTRQLAALRAKYPHLLINYTIWARPESRTQALGIELTFVSYHVAIHGKMPPEQLRPNPF